MISEKIRKVRSVLLSGYYLGINKPWCVVFPRTVDAHMSYYSCRSDCIRYIKQLSFNFIADCNLVVYKKDTLRFSSVYY